MMKKLDCRTPWTRHWYIARSTHYIKFMTATHGLSQSHTTYELLSTWGPTKVETVNGPVTKPKIFIIKIFRAVTKYGHGALMWQQPPSNITLFGTEHFSISVPQILTTTLVKKRNYSCSELSQTSRSNRVYAVADPGGRGGHGPPGPVKIGHKKDGRQRRPHRFHVSRPPLPGRWIRYCYVLSFFVTDVTVRRHSTLPVSVWEVALVELSDKIPQFVLNLLSVNLLFIVCIFWAKIITKKDASVIKTCHFCPFCVVLMFNMASQ